MELKEIKKVLDEAKYKENIVYVRIFINNIG